ncbi:MAG: putative ABC-type ATPase [Verrucomicrobiales bacterium]|jgi:predicted ABC-type ATPase
MDWKTSLDERPIVVAVAGSNGAGKTTFFQAHLAETGLRFVNADELALELGIGVYEAAEMADALRRALVERGESFVFETVFSDPVGEKVEFLKQLVGKGYQVALIFIRVDSVDASRQRVAMRVMKGGHDVPDEKLEARFERTLANLDRAIEALPLVIVFDNSDLRSPYRLEAVYFEGEAQAIE